MFRYVAYGTTGNIGNALRELFEKQKKLTPQDEFIQLIKRKSPLAQKMHGSRRIEFITHRIDQNCSSYQTE